MISIVIPAYNESKTIEELLKKVVKIKFVDDEEFEIILVDDASKDDTSAISDKFLSNAGVKYKILKNKNNLGKSQTVKKGLLETKGDVVVVQDADLEYNPEDLVFMHTNMKKYGVDVVYGNRFGRDNGVGYMKNFYGNLCLSFISNLFTIHRTRVSIPDMEVCYKMIKGDIARDIAPTIKSTSNFGIEPEITAKLSKYKDKEGGNLQFFTLPISYYPRTIEEGKKMHALKDGAKALIEIIKFNLF